MLENRKLRLGLIIPTPPPYGGIANWSENLIESLQKRNIEYYIINTAPKKRVTEGRNILDRIFQGGVQLCNQRWALHKWVKKNKVNVVHMTTSGSLAIIRDLVLARYAHKCNIPIIYHIHYGTIPDSILNNGLQWKALKHVFKYVQCIVAIDLRTYESIKKYNNKLNLKYIPNFINPCKMPTCSKKTRKEVTFLGWCIKTKGIEELIEAWGKLEKIGEWKLNLVGPYEKNYIDTVLQNPSNKNIILWGEVNHERAMQILNQSSVFVLPSYTEGFPMSVLEAMILGKAIIATDVGNIRTMLDEESGLLIKKNDVDELEWALKKCMFDDEFRFELGKNAKKRVYQNYIEKIVFEEYMECWKET